jgi:CHAT domain-containing protein
VEDQRPDRPATTNVISPPVVVPESSSFDISYTTLEDNLSREFVSYLGLEQQPLPTTPDEASSIAQEIEDATGARPAFVYLNFVPASAIPGTTLAPQDSDQLELVVISARGGLVRRRVPEATRVEVMAMAQEFRNEITNPRLVNTTSYLPSAQQLYQWFITPISADLEERGITNLVFLPVAGLRSLPFAALHDGEEFIIENYSLGLMPSLSLTDTRYEDIRDSDILAMGVSESVEGLSPLPTVPVEVATLVLQLWRGGRIFLNQDATLDTLRGIRQQQPFGIIHMATHADFIPGPVSNSYIQLWDNKLQLNQVRQLGWNDPPVQMLVLSACRTALGDEEAELGFAGLAVQTGVKSAVASLWYVSDVATAALMTEFYQELEIAPIKAEALRLAQLAMARGEISLENGTLTGFRSAISLPLPSDSVAQIRSDLTHPYYWAAFTIIGNPW